MRLLISGWYYGNAACFTVANDGSPWYLTYVWWEMSQTVWGDEVRLMHFNGSTWAGTWGASGQGTPIPLALVPHGDGVSRACVSLASDVLLCDDDTVASVSDNTVAGLAYSAEDVPLVAWVPRYAEAVPVFASRTNRWHTEAIPGPAGTGGIDIEVDVLGRPVIVYATPGNGLWCAVGTDVVGTEETPDGRLGTPKAGATVLSGASGLKCDTSSVLYDATGRRVAAPKAGVYFVREQGRTRKVIIAR